MVSQAAQIATGPGRRHDEPVQHCTCPPVGGRFGLRTRARRLGVPGATGGVRPGPGLAGQGQA